MNNETAGARARCRPVGRRLALPSAVMVTWVAVVASACTAVPVPVRIDPAPLPASTSAVAPTPTEPPSPTPATPAPTQRIVFGDPWSADQKRVHAVVESALKIIDETGRGERITMTIFNATYPKVADTLIRAHLRGVDVRIVVNEEKSRSRQVRKLQRALGATKSARSWVVVRGGGVRMHSKFLLASRSGGKENVVWVSSGNFTMASGRNQINEAFVTTGDRELYDFILDQFALLSRNVASAERLGRTAVTSTAEVSTFPITEGGPEHDPVQALLDDVACVHGEDRTVIRMAHLLLTKERVYLTDRLRELKAEGCDVRVVMHERGWIRTGRQNLVRAGAGQVDLRAVDGAVLHTKITTIDGWDAAGARLQVAMVGTHNLSGRALTTVPQGYNDELALAVHTPAIVTRYSTWVDQLIEDHTRSTVRSR